MRVDLIYMSTRVVVAQVSTTAARVDLAVVKVVPTAAEVGLAKM